FDATVADLNLVDEAIAGHVGEEEIEREILIEWDPRSAGLWPRNLYGIAESVFPFAREPQDLAGAGENQVRAPVRVQVEPLSCRSGFEVRQLWKGPELTPLVGIAIELIVAGGAAVRDGHVRVSVAVEIVQDAIGKPRGGLARDDLRRREIARAFVR